MAVDFATAHALWGWGTATAAAVQAPAPSLPVADWPALVTYRKAHRLSPWTLDQRTVAKARFDQHAKAGTKVATLQDMARELGICRQALDKALHAERKRPEAPAPAPAATVVRDGRKVA